MALLMRITRKLLYSEEYLHFTLTNLKQWKKEKVNVGYIIAILKSEENQDAFPPSHHITTRKDMENTGFNKMNLPTHMLTNKEARIRQLKDGEVDSNHEMAIRLKNLVKGVV